MIDSTCKVWSMRSYYLWTGVALGCLMILAIAAIIFGMAKVCQICCHNPKQSNTTETVVMKTTDNYDDQAEQSQMESRDTLSADNQGKVRFDSDKLNTLNTPRIPIESRIISLNANEQVQV